MNRIDSQQDLYVLMENTIKIGALIIESGAEVYRAEDSIYRIMNSFGFNEVSVFATPIMLLVSVRAFGQNNTDSVRITPSAPNLSRIYKINQLSRDIAEKKVNLEDITARIQELKEHTSMSYINRIIFSIIACSGYCYLYGGTILECVVSGFVTALVVSFMPYLARKKINYFLRTFIGSALIGLLSVVIESFLKLPVNKDFIIIGAIIHFVPGVALTNSMRDMMSGDYLSGTMKLIEATFTAFAIALGIGIFLGLVK